MSFYKQVQKQAVAIKIGDRFFCGFWKKQRVHTAWSLAGASLYLSIYDDKVKEILAALEAKKKPEVIFIKHKSG